MLKPLSPGWVQASIIWGEVALCRDHQGEFISEPVFFCGMDDEAQGWTVIEHARAIHVESMNLARSVWGLPPLDWPEGVPPPREH